MDINLYHKIVCRDERLIFKIIYNDQLSLTFIEARKLNLNICKNVFPSTFALYLSLVAHEYRV